MKGRFAFSVTARDRKRLTDELRSKLNGLLVVHINNLDYIGVEIEIRSGFIDFTEYYKADGDLREGYARDLKNGFVNINHHHLEKYFFGKGLAVLVQIMEIVNTIHNTHPVKGEKYMIDMWLGREGRLYQNKRNGQNVLK